MDKPQVLPKPKRVVIGATAHSELSALLHERRPDLETRGRPYTEITPDDLDWADTYMGFLRPRLSTMGNVRWVHCTGAGVDSWLRPGELSREILLTRTSESFGVYIAEWALARALAFRQQIVDLADAQRRHEWAPREIGYLRGSRAVVVGTGDVGSHIARLFAAVGATVHGVSRSGRGDPTVFATTSTVSELTRLARQTDWLILTVPLTSETRGMIGRDVLSACRGAVLMNAGRGAVVDEKVIPEALDKGWLSGAILDVFETEPLPKDSPLWDDRRVMISPHISGLTTPEGAIEGFLECLDEIERGRMPARVVDRDREY
ncbi:MAG TPA: D-2-hydroxyacid dehydrogenase [Gemmatimonadaceae bacterium]|nr:D-2-hydroxyacid dehydrogenase [Gemmatimonadaceae bacterium]